MTGSATLKAAEALRELIFKGILPPGSDHLEAELADRLGLSRTPVREALARLEAQGLVSIRPRRGARVIGLSARDMDDVYEILTALEATAAARAAALRPADAALSPMERAIEEMDRALEIGDLDVWAAADEAFHSALVTLSGNGRLIEAAAIYADQVRRARMITLRLRPPPHRSNEDHRAVLAAIRAGDSDLAHRLHAGHREAARKLLTDLIRTHQLNQV
ncbi:MAG: GntR family transcriptional regulator [Pseudomonadota bacterium]